MLMAIKISRIMRKIFALIFWTIPVVQITFSSLGIEMLSQKGNGVTMAASFYFSSRNGNDNNSGTSSASPWKSMEKLNQIAASLKAGDIVYFERGSEWEKVKISISNLQGNSSSPILFAAYGSGAKPRFKGSKIIGSFTKEGNIWYKTDNDLPDYIPTTRRIIPYVFINETRYGVSRFPNTGILTTKTNGTKTYLDDYTQTWSNNQWSNGMISIRCVAWDWTSRKILSNTSTRMNLDALPLGISKSSTDYIIHNHKNACDVIGEWAQQNDTIWIFYAENLNDKVVEVPVVDTIVKINNCKYIKFENLQFERGVMTDIFAQQSVITLDKCNITDAGNALMLIQSNSYMNMHDCALSHGGRAGIYMDESGGDLFDNTFKDMVSDGANNGDGANGSCINNWHCNAVTRIHHNYFENINIAFNGHWSNAETYIYRNYINGYGKTIEDCGAIYIGGDFTNFKKYVTRNIILNAGNKFCHALYMDYLTSNVVADSNTIYNSNIAFNFHVCDDNLVRYNNVVFPAKDMGYPWGSAFRFDEYSFNHGKEGNEVRRNSIENNNVVLSSNADEVTSAFLNVTYINENTSKNNKFFDPFTEDDDIFVKGDDYNIGTYHSYSLSNWSVSTGLENGSTRNPTGWTFKSVSGIDKQDFVKLLINPTDKDSIFNLKLFGAKYIDVNGTLFSDNIKVPPYFSVILFYKEAQTETNSSPVVQNAKFTYYLRESDNETIGQIIASDPETYQRLSYAITAGNKNNLVGINEETGSIFIVNKNVVLSEVTTLVLTIEVSDNGSPALIGTGTAEITLIPFNNPPLINNQNFTLDENDGISTELGKINATNVETDQTLSFHIVSGDPDGHFELDANSGDLSLASDDIEFLRNASSVLEIRVEDNGTIVKSATAYVTINLVPAVKQASTTSYIDPTHINDAQEDGSVQHPFDSWGDVTWEEGHTYLQKRGTTAISKKINVYAGNVILGAYGDGEEKPIISSSTNDFAIRVYEKSNITIRDLSVIANDALSCVYFLGENNNNILIENCRFEGAENGLRIINGKSFVVKYCVFNNKSDAIYSYAENTEVYYNIFKSNAAGVNVGSYLSKAKVYNNVFYDNRQGITASYADLTIYNNIFYLTHKGDVAINNNVDKMISDHNIFYPEQKGFITIASKSYQSLNEYQKDMGLDLNSFTKDPMFQDMYNENFSISSMSPAIDAGINVGLDFDYLGVAVPTGGAPDIGLIESNGQQKTATGILQHNDDGLANELSVYPNPSDGRFNLYVGVADISNSNIQVVDISGRLVYSQTHNSSSSACVPIDISGKAKGIYIVVLESNGKKYSERILVR
jgi:hypothetical protein